MSGATGTAMGRSSGKGITGNSNLQHMVLGGAGSNDYDASGSFGGRPMTAIDELVQQRLEMIAHQLEE